MSTKLIAGAAGGLLLIPIGWQAGGAFAVLITANAPIIGLVGGGLVLALALAGLRIVFAAGRLASARARIAELAMMQNGQPIHVDDVSLYAVPLIAHTLDRFYSVEEKRAAATPALSHLHIEQHPAVPAELLAQLLSGGSGAGAPQLAGPDAAPQLVAVDEWRGWIERAPHLLIAGRTEAGKTTLATAILIDRVLAGDAVLVLDPHYQPGKWAGVPTIGGGNDFEAILRTLPFLVGEMRARFKEFERGRPTEDFQRLTVLIDEVPAVVSACQELTPSGGRKIVDPRWGKFAQRLGSEARKVRISVILLTQSTLVQDIQINSQQRDNYLRIGLGDRVPTLLGEETNSRRRAQLHELRVGQGHPAAMEWLGEIHMLDTAAVPALAARSLGPAVKVWTPPALPNHAPPATPKPPGPSAQPPRQAPPTAQLPPPTIPDQIVMLLDARPWLTSSEIAAALGIDLQVARVEITGLRKALDRRPAAEGKSDRYEYSLSKPLNELMAERVAISA